MVLKFNPHYNLHGKHSVLSASSSSWVNYDGEKMVDVFLNSLEAARGTELHEIANKLIRNGIKLPKTSQTLSLFVNDAIGLHMSSEVVLYYSDNAFGTADALWFGPVPGDDSRYLLRVHDLKTGKTKTTVRQLEVYAAYFCLEYGYDPYDIDMELRIYQNDERISYLADPADVKAIMDKIVYFDEIITKLRNGEVL